MPTASPFSLPSLTGTAPAFDPTAAPENPGALFAAWFDEAVRGEVVEPHAMTLSTVDGLGLPDARVLILKDLDPAGRWAFSSSAASAKGRQLAAAPAAALTFWWPAQVRSIRIRGTVEADSAVASAEDFLERGAGARAVALSGTQSATLADPALLAAEITAAGARQDEVEPTWRKYWLTAGSVEFWQGDPGRRHVRLRYDRTAGGWTRSRLRP